MDDNYEAVRLTKDILLEFEQKTKMHPFKMIDLYLVRCAETPGDVSELLSPRRSP